MENRNTGNHIFLIILDGRAFMGEGLTVLQHIDTPAVVIDVTRALVGFSKIYWDKQRLFTIKEGAAVAGLTAGSLGNWITDGTVKPTRRGGKGRGLCALFDYWACFALGVLGSLSRQGVSPQLLKRAFRLLTTAGREETKPAIAQKEAVGQVI
jgi:hypothetical protein